MYLDSILLSVYLLHFRRDVLEHLLQLQNFSNQFLPNALRKLFNSISAPDNRGDYLTDIMDKFAQRFCSCNPKLGLDKGNLIVLSLLKSSYTCIKRNSLSAVSDKEHIARVFEEHMPPRSFIVKCDYHKSICVLKSVVTRLKIALLQKVNESILKYLHYTAWVPFTLWRVDLKKFKTTFTYSTCSTTFCYWICKFIVLHC